MKKIFFIVILSCIAKSNFAQEFPKAIFLDEDTLARDDQTILINDVTANKGVCMFRSSASSASTMWYGPYFHIAGGNYLLQFRLKVSSNTAASNVLQLDIVDFAGGTLYKKLVLKPNMFKANNEWQLFTIPVVLPENTNGVEIRGVAFQPGLTDVYFDYAQLIPNDVVGLYTDEFTLTGKGNVGIGTTIPNEKLAVNGKIRAKEIKVEASNWPDYVFEKGYQVGTLEELERYIKANKRLPEMPSAKEIENNGLQVGEVLKLQQKKIEELTLHLIEKDKELQKERDRITKLEEIVKQILEKKN